MSNTLNESQPQMKTTLRNRFQNRSQHKQHLLLDKYSLTDI